MNAAMPVWACEDERLLASIYRFTHAGCSSLQDSGSVQAFLQLWRRLLERLQDDEREKQPAAQRLWPGLAPADLQRLQLAVDGLASAWPFGEYGCLLVLLQPGQPDLGPVPGSLAVMLVGLDSWRFDVHSTDGGGIRHTASCEGSTVLCLGQVEANQLSSFNRNLESVMAAVAERKGDARSAAVGRQGHQKTPAMVAAAVRQALEQTRSDAAAAAGGQQAGKVQECVPQGGFTDVGLHTGGLPRDTAWPLVRMAVQAMLAMPPPAAAAPPDLFQLAEAHLHLWLMQRQVALLQPDSANARVVNAAMLMLGAVASRAAELAQRGHSVQHLQAACTASRAAIEAAQAARVQAAAKTACLPLLGGSNNPCGPGSWRLPCGTVPPLSPPQSDSGGRGAAEKRQGRNLGSLPLLAEAPNGQQPSFADLLAVLRSVQLQGAGDLKAQHALCLVERVLFGWAAAGLQAAAGLGQQEVDALVEVVEAYRAVLHTFQASPAAEARMHADLCSRFLLVAWVALCLVHAAAGRQHPLLLEYGVGVSWQDLRHLVLSDKQAEDAMLAVAAYLRRHTKPCKAVFTLADNGKATFELAARFATQNHSMQRLWQEEQAAAQRRADGHWAEVRRKQNKAALLRTLLKQQRQAEKEARVAADQAGTSLGSGQGHRGSTEALPKEAAALQWAMPCYGGCSETAPSRGNQAIARQDERPHWLSKPAFLAFGSLRAYGVLQGRRLATALHERALPWGQPAVATLVRQALYHVGPFTDEAAPQRLWRTDWRGGGEGGMLPTMCAELSSLAGELENAPREHAAVRLLGEVAAYLSDWHPPLRDVARRFAAAAARWAEELEGSAAELLPDRAQALRAKQCLLRCTALLCHAAGQLSDADVEGILGLAVLVHHGSIHAAGTELEAELQRLQVLCHWALARRIDAILAAVARRPAILTSALHRVLQRAPTDLRWGHLRWCTVQPQQPSSSFEASGSDGCLYSINCLDGTVLEDGAPPGRLPREVLDHPLYRRCFGSWGFEVSLTATGVRRTIAPVRGCFYEFYLAGPDGSELVVAEVEAATGRRMQLLDPGADLSGGSWGAELPRQLRELHSHWLDREARTIVLRPVHFRDREAAFILQWQPPPPQPPHPQQQPDRAQPADAAQQPQAAAVSFVCRRVPAHLPHRADWRRLLAECGSQLPDQLVLHKSAVTQLLTKFENSGFIHMYVPAGCSSSSSGGGISSGSGGGGGGGAIKKRKLSSTGACSSGASGSADSTAAVADDASSTGARQMLFELPRFGLEFELAGGQLRSLDHAGYVLAPCQQLWQPGAHWEDCAGSNGEDGSSCSCGGSSSSYTLPDFWQYLILQPAGNARSSCGSDGSCGGTVVQQRTLVLLPVGLVVRTEDGVEVEHGSNSGDALQTHILEVHPRFGHLCARSIPARLQLAALYAATGSLLPEPLNRMTGAQQAMALLRQCWGVRPLGAGDVQLLQDVAALGGAQAAGLRLLSHELLASAASLNSLHFPPPAETPEWCLMPDLNPDWLAAYEAERRRCGGLNPRLLLSGEENQRVAGLVCCPDPPPLWHRLGLYRADEVPACPVPADAVAQAEAALQQLVLAAGSDDPSSAAKLPAYPLQVGGNPAGAAAAPPTPLQRAMHAELQDSWDSHHSVPLAEAVQPGAQAAVLEMQATVQRQRQQAESYLHTHLGSVPPSTGPAGTAFRLQRAAGAAPEHGPLNLLSLALPAGQQLALQLNPFLSAESAERLQQGARTWLQLCVLEDRLQRLVRLAEAAESDDDAMVHLARELAVYRSWSVEEHPCWLALEAEQQLQIRPQQHWVAAHLMANWAHWEGKTRVVVPMLILHWADGDNLVRLNLLPALLEEAYEHLHCVLSASALRRRLFVLPFHRDVRPTAGLLAAMHAALMHCQQSGGVLLTTPEWRLSLHLKQQELWEQGQRELVAAMSKLAELPYVDLLDESDELLTHRFQLIYAWGSPTELPSQQARTSACQALLRTLSAEGRSGQLGATLAQEGVAVSSGAALHKPGGFRGVRLLPGPALEQAAGQLRSQLAQALLADPPYVMRWMRHRAVKDLLRWVTDLAIDARAELAAAQPPLSDDERADVLALRGLLACGVLEHCLTMRHLVDYGLDGRPTARKRLAVPYRAAHVPSERSEYAQPDTALTLTQLAFYHRGLLREQLLDALRELLRLGLNAQQAHYDEWLALARAEVPPEEHAARLVPLDSPAKLDTSNGEQVEALYALFSHNMAAIDFYLNFCVYPSETRQYASRLVATAWDLARTPGGRVVGFSGTNDSHRLLPLAVRQSLAVDPRLRGTNGHMLAVLLANPRYDTLLPEQGTPVWEALLRFAVQQGVDAVIDCGALLAGVSNRAAADFLLRLLDRGRYRGVCYYDEGERQWVVCDMQGRCLPRHCSPIREGQAFTLFDEARCRGADLQLRPDAQGLLTLGPASCKDKLMQAAGRLRRLGKGQGLRTVGTADVTAKIARLAGHSISSSDSSRKGGSGSSGSQLSSRDVLAWAMANTVGATQRGVLEWAHQGLLFAATHGSPEHALQPEVLELADMYGGARSLCAVPAPVAQHGRQHATAPREQPLASDMRQLLDRVVSTASDLGAGHEVVAQGGMGFGEECERELEREEEEEAEEERQVPRATAAAEADWDYAAALAAPSLTALQQQAGLQLLRLRQLAAQVEPAAVGALPWSPWVWSTANFAQAVQLPAGQAANEYLRPVSELLLLPSADKPGGGAAAGGGDAMLAALLLSEREASGLLEALWACSSSGSSASSSSSTVDCASCSPSKASFGRSPAGWQPLLVSLCYAAAAQPLRNGGEAPPLRLAAAVGGSSNRGRGDSGSLAARLQAGDLRAQLVSLQLWDGETTFAEPAGLGDMGWEAQHALPTLARLRRLVAGQRGAAEALVAMRGKAVLFAHSQLERACDAESGGGGGAYPASP